MSRDTSMVYNDYSVKVKTGKLDIQLNKICSFRSFG